MEVKCPKCRYRFEVWRAPGASEIACVCPRCGTPFNYEVPDDEPSVDNDEAESPSAPAEKPTVVEQSAVSNESSEPVSQPEECNQQPEEPSEEKQPTAKGYSVNPTSDIPQRLSPDASVINPPKKKGCCSFKLFFFIILIIIAAIIFGPRACSHEESFVGEDVEDNSVADSYEEVPSDTINTTVKSSDAKPTPDWVFGRWQVETEYGTIEVHIADKWISEKSEGGTCHGVFYYTPGQLNCTFRDDGRDVKTFYRLDEDNHRIDAGEGMWMTKVK